MRLSVGTSDMEVAYLVVVVSSVLFLFVDGQALSTTLAMNIVQKTQNGPIGFKSVDPAGANVVIENTSYGPRAKAQNLNGWRITKELNGRIAFSVELDGDLKVKPNHYVVLFAKGASNEATSDNKVIVDLFSWGTEPGVFKLLDEGGFVQATLVVRGV